MEQSFIKNTHKILRFLPDFICKKTPDFQLVFNFEQTSTVTMIFGEHGIMAHVLLVAKPIIALELHYLRIQFLMLIIIFHHR